MTRRIFRAICLVAAALLVLCTGCMAALTAHALTERFTDDLAREAALLRGLAESEGAAGLEALSPSAARITLIGSDGTVLFDSKADPTVMENHASREEFAEARADGTGISIRYSSTLSTQTVYYALLLRDGSVLRVAGEQAAISSILLNLLPAFILLLAAAVLAASVLARRLSRAIVRPINALDLSDPLSDAAYPELSPLLTRIDRQNGTIARQFEIARQRQREFTLITDNMAEGLLVLSPSSEILSCNAAASRILHAPHDVLRRSVYDLNREPPFRAAVETALSGAHAEEQLTIGEGHYQLIASPVQQDKEVRGAVLLLIDVTERAEREQLRREFSANVSHELKTPLTSISGFAEIVRDGLVEPEDIPRFAGRIYDEAQRLIALVSDIIRLSRLDEGQLTGQTDPVELRALCADVAARLTPAAEQAGVHLDLYGDPVWIDGVPTILDEMIYNLCENAVKYNKPGGSVRISLSASGGGVQLTVADTGIGIPYADQPRVFERFYRVDKSHSKEIGGTGLGLSIVKHGAALHGAHIELDSAVGVGTTITLTFRQRAAHDENAK